MKPPPEYGDVERTDLARTPATGAERTICAVTTQFVSGETRSGCGLRGGRRSPGEGADLAQVAARMRSSTSRRPVWCAPITDLTVLPTEEFNRFPQSSQPRTDQARTSGARVTKHRRLHVMVQPVPRSSRARTRKSPTNSPDSAIIRSISSTKPGPSRNRPSGSVTSPEPPKL